MEKIDILNREEYVNKLVNLTENISTSRTSTSFAINGAWGCGKSFVLDMYEERLSEIQSEENAPDKYFVIRYNCWKYDYYEEPLVAIVAAMIDIINQKTKLWNDEKKKAYVLGALKAIGTTFLSMTNSAIKDKTGLDIQSAYKTTKSKIGKEKIKIKNSHEYDIYFSFNHALHSLQELIGDLSKDQTIVFMVDELDRCLPEYSIKVLERLHHLTENTDNVITVLSIDKAQLEKSVKQIFGFEQPEKYLEKFIQFEVKLNYGEISKQALTKYDNYISLFDDSCPFNDSIEEFIKVIFKNINIRTQEQLMKKALIAHSLLFKKPKSKVFMCMELLIVVINDCYNGKIPFCEFLQQNTFSRESSKEDPPFARFFNDRFEELPCDKIQQTGSMTATVYMYNVSKSLYADILFLWSNVFLTNKRVVVSLTDTITQTILAVEIDDLKKFDNTIKFIQ